MCEVAEFDLVEVFQEHVVCRGLISGAIRCCSKLPLKVLFLVGAIRSRVFILQYDFLRNCLVFVDGVLAGSHLLKQSCLVFMSSY